MKGKFYGIGVGVGDPELLTIKAVNRLKNLDCIVLPEAKSGEGSTAFEIAKEYLKENTEKLYLEFPMIKDLDKKIEIRKNNAQIIAKKKKKGKNIGFLTIGDPMIYSTYSYVLDYLKKEYEVETIPGITSFGSIGSRLNIPLVVGNEDLKIISVDKNTDFEKEIKNNDNLVLMKVTRNFEEIKNVLIKTKNEKNAVLVSNCGKENEKIYYNLEEVVEVPYFSTIIIKKGGLGE